MELPILIEPLPDNGGYLAQLGAPFHLSAKAATADEAHQMVGTQLQQRIQQGLELRPLRVPSAASSASGPGWLKDDELTQEWLEYVQGYRDECDAADHRRLLTDGDVGETAS